MNYQLIKYYKDTYTDDFNKYFHQECNSDDIIVSTLVPKTMGYPAKNPSESIFFASITWFSLRKQQYHSSFSYACLVYAITRSDLL